MLKRMNRGFTLIELMIGLTIMALLLVFAMPGYQVFLENQKLRARAESILSGLQSARQEAIRLNTDVTFMLTDTVPTQASVDGANPSTDGPHWLVSGMVIDAAAGTSTLTLLDSQLSEETGGNSPSVIEADIAQIAFTPFGTINGGTTQTIEITPSAGSCVAEGGSARCLSVQVSASGQVRMCDPAVTKPGDTRRC